MVILQACMCVYASILDFCICVHVSTQSRMIHVSIGFIIRTYMYACMHLAIRTYIHVRVCVYIYIPTYIYIYIYIYIYTLFSPFLVNRASWYVMFVCMNVRICSIFPVLSGLRLLSIHIYVFIDMFVCGLKPTDYKTHSHIIL
jgi:hypothetical protein